MTSSSVLFTTTCVFQVGLGFITLTGRLCFGCTSTYHQVYITKMQQYVTEGIHTLHTKSVSQLKMKRFRLRIKAIDTEEEVNLIYSCGSSLCTCVCVVFSKRFYSANDGTMMILLLLRCEQCE